MLRVLAILTVLAMSTSVTLAAQTTHQTTLDNSIQANFSVVTSSPPRLDPSSDFVTDARAVRDAMLGAGWTSSDGAISWTVGGVPIVWCGVSHTINADDIILLVTALDDTTGFDADAEVTGDNSTCYAVAGFGNVTGRPGDGGDATAINTDTPRAHGIAGAWAGHSSFAGDGGSASAWADNGLAHAVAGSANNGDGGNATADGAISSVAIVGDSAGGGIGGDATAGTNMVSDSAAATGGAADGNGGDATAVGTSDAQAYGGAGSVSGSAGTGGEATATSSAGTAYAVGGDSDLGDAGDATATGASGDVWALGGHSDTGDGGDADSTNAGGHAGAIGGDSDTGDGGIATATNTAGSAEAQGGSSATGNGSTAIATGTTSAIAYGGNATSAGAGTTGGDAIATVPVNGSGNAYAEAGSGRAGGDATAASGAAGGHAEALGGLGVHPTAGPATGGDARAFANVASATATATSKNVSATSGQAGFAEATNSALSTNGYYPGPGVTTGGTVNNP